MSGAHLTEHGEAKLRKLGNVFEGRLVEMFLEDPRPIMKRDKPEVYKGDDLKENTDA